MNKRQKRKKKKKEGKKRTEKQAREIERIELDMDELESILDRAKVAPLGKDEYEKLRAALETLLFLTQELEKKRVSVQRLKKLLFGAATEKTSEVLKNILDKLKAGKGSAGDAAAGKDSVADQNDKKKRKGHGRNGADAYNGAEKIKVPHESLSPGDSCPDCIKGRVYENIKPGVILRVRGQPPLGAAVYKLQKLRCNLCGEVFTAKAPEGIGEEKYDAASASMIGLLKYGSGLPFNRLQRLQGNLGIPLPASTQWEIVESASRKIIPVYKELIRQAAQGEVLHNDDTTMKILDLMGQNQDKREEGAKDSSERKGLFTSGIISKIDNHKIALFFTGRKHAGENLEQVLAMRASKLNSLVQMCDGLSRNLPKNLPEELKIIVSNCLAHARRGFVDVAGSFPDECLHVLGILKDVYRNDALARERNMSPQERLRFHKAESGPLMDKLGTWFNAQFDERKVEPNSGLGEAISYMLKRWDKLTRFLNVPGAPLDNNICERALKKVILHRKNAYFYKTENGAHVGDLYMSLIHTAELCGVNPFDYLTELQKHADEFQDAPQDWMPWNYRNMLESAVAPPPDP